MADETQEVGGRDDLHNALHQRLVETGEWDRLQTLLRRMLQDCGWEAELAQTAREKAKAQRELHLGSLVAELAPHARGECAGLRRFIWSIAMEEEEGQGRRPAIP